MFARTPTGEPVAECELAVGEVGLLRGLAATAAATGAAFLRIHCAADLNLAGLGCPRPPVALLMKADPKPEPLPRRWLQIDICVPQLMSSDGPATEQNGGSARVPSDLLLHSP